MAAKGVYDRVETRSIDYVSQAERHGKAWHQAPFWFTGNFLLGTLIIGFIGPSLGLGLGWTILASVCAAAFGTFFMAFHANQGPRMGLPQMIQSRAQFGVRGALVPLLAVIFVYIGFAIFGVIFAADALDAVFGIDPAISYAVIVALSAIVAVVGYDLIHILLRWLTYLVVPVFLAITAIAVFTLQPTAQSAGGGDIALWLLQFGAAAGYQISYAVYVSDYSRYLPANVSSRALIAWTYLGATLSAAWMMSLGALIASSVPLADALPNIKELGDSWFAGFGGFALIAVIPSTIAATAVAFYGSMLSGLSVVEAFRPVKLGRTARVVSILAFAALSLVITYALPAEYLGSFGAFLTMMLYVLIPWTAVNLVDFYLVRHGHYAITEIFDPNGIYGRWGWRGLVAYGAGIVAMVPFMSFSFFMGPLAAAMGGVDLAFVVGLLVSGVLYFILMRFADLSGEASAIEASACKLGDTPQPRDVEIVTP